MTFQKNYSLQKFNTFGLDVKASFFTEINDQEQAKLLLDQFQNQPIFILGGGSNILFTKNIEGIVVKNNILGIEIVDKNEENIWLKIGAGEIWQNLVQYCVAHDFGGIENLSLIYGSVGAAPIQNIGAYGVEVKDILENVIGINLENGQIQTFGKEDCNFAYRDSIFKQTFKGKILITHIVLKLTLKKHIFKTDYGDIQKILAEKKVKNLSVKIISETICQIRQSKLPDPAVWGNCGSFFKNPEISEPKFKILQEKYPNVPSYPTQNGVKVPAGWLIEQAGLKGKRVGNVGTHEKQALVIVNYGNASGQQIWDFSKQIQAAVFEKFGVSLQAEVNIL